MLQLLLPDSLNFCQLLGQISTFQRGNRVDLVREFPLQVLRPSLLHFMAHKLEKDFFELHMGPHRLVQNTVHDRLFHGLEQRLELVLNIDNWEGLFNLENVQHSCEPAIDHQLVHILECEQQRNVSAHDVHVHWRVEVEVGDLGLFGTFCVESFCQVFGFPDFEELVDQLENFG